ncbi:MAG: amidohydrolase [Evtepia sp.]
MKKLYYNGTIVTMEPELYTQAVLTDAGIIVRVGTFETLRAFAPEAEPIDLQGNTMIPAFLDAHGHFSSYANAQLQVALEESTSFDEIAQRISSFLSSKQIPQGTWIVAKGYDHNTLVEKCHPSKAFLDHIAPNHPLLLQHQSGHCGVLNSAALDALHITPITPPPDGGVIGCADGELTGYMEESAYIHCIKQVPMSDMKTMLDAYRQAQNNYLAYGITTVQEGMMVAQMLPLYQALINSGLLSLDLVGYSDMASMNALSAAFPNAVKQYDRHFKIGGYKIILDGSPQVKTAWMKTPYQNDTSSGYGTMSDTDVISAVSTAAKNEFQILAHCNGDAAIEQYIHAVQKVAEKQKNISNLKPVIIHAQLIAKDQLAAVAKLHMIPSFFIAHVLHWGDIHIKNFGYDRAQSISPAHSALSHDIPFTFHQDAPVIEPNMLETIQCAVTRTSKTGIVLGKQECISALDALKALTIHAASQYFEEKTKGSIAAGKHADFVILSDNPLTVAKDKISRILVLETIKDGASLFRRKRTL